VGCARGILGLYCTVLLCFFVTAVDYSWRYVDNLIGRHCNGLHLYIVLCAGNYVSCNYIYNVRWCIYLDAASSGVTMEGGVCNGTWAVSNSTAGSCELLSSQAAKFQKGVVLNGLQHCTVLYCCSTVLYCIALHCSAL